MTHVRRLLAAAAFASLVAGALCPTAALSAEFEPVNLTIAFTGDVSGYLEPCG